MSQGKFASNFTSNITFVVNGAAKVGVGGHNVQGLDASIRHNGLPGSPAVAPGPKYLSLALRAPRPWKTSISSDFPAVKFGVIAKHSHLWSNKHAAWELILTIFSGLEAAKQRHVSSIQVGPR